LDVTAQCRLSNIKNARRLAEAAQVSNLDEIADLPQFQVRVSVTDEVTQSIVQCAFAP
jgi:hypothetical protein